MRHIDDRLIRQGEGLHGCGVGELVGVGVHTAHVEGLVVHFLDQLGTFFDVVFDSLFEGCDFIFHVDFDYCSTELMPLMGLLKE